MIKPYNLAISNFASFNLNSILDLFKADLVLMPDMPELYPSKNLPKNYFYIGPLVWEPKNKLPSKTKKLKDFIYVSMGSSADPKIFDLVINSLLQLKHPAIVTLGGIRKKSEFNNLPKSIQIYDFLPGSSVIKNSKFVICQGGIGTMYQALSQGKPIIGVPYTFEQESFGINIFEKLGVAVKISPIGLDEKNLIRRVNSFIENNSYLNYLKIAEKFSKKISLERGQVIAAEMIDLLD